MASRRPLQDQTLRAELVHVGMSFWWAFEGLLHAVHAERHMRFHLFAAIGVLCGAVAFRVEPYEKIALIIMICLVLSFEIVNTAVERLADFPGQIDSLLKAAKDTAAGAVLVMSLGSVTVGGFILLPRLLKKAAAQQLTAAHVVDRFEFGFFSLAGVLGALLLFWWCRRWRPIRTWMLVGSSLACGFVTAWIAVAGRDPSTPWVILFLQALLLNGFARTGVALKEGWNRPDLPYDMSAMKVVVPALLAGVVIGLVAGYLWVDGAALTIDRILA